MDTIGTDSTDTLFDHYLPPKGWGDIATKQDLASLGTELRGEIAQLRGEMHGEIGNLRAEMHNAFRVQTYALVMLIVALVGILIGLQQAGITR